MSGVTPEVLAQRARFSASSWRSQYRPCSTLSRLHSLQFLELDGVVKISPRALVVNSISIPEWCDKTSQTAKQSERKIAIHSSPPSLRDGVVEVGSLGTCGWGVVFRWGTMYYGFLELDLRKFPFLSCRSA